MPVLSLFDDPSRFHSIIQQTAFNLVLIKHTAHYYTTIFLWCLFFFFVNLSSAYILKRKVMFYKSLGNFGKATINFSPSNSVNRWNKV